MQFSVESVINMSIKLFSVLIAFGHVVSGFHISIDQIKANKQETRIVGGTDAPPGYAPHMVALVFGEPTTLLTCGGSIMGPKLVLTAAHCIVAVMIQPDVLVSSYRGIIGANDYTIPPRNVVYFDKHVIHPRYDSLNFKNDIAVLITTRPIVYEFGIAPIRLDFEYIHHNEDCYVTGWGNTAYLGPSPNKLQLLNVSTIQHEVCVHMVNASSHPWPPTAVDPVVEICTFHSPGYGMCHGDSGSALVSRRTGLQIGIVAWGFPCAAGAPDVFARITGFKDFLKPFLTIPR